MSPVTTPYEALQALYPGTLIERHDGSSPAPT